MTIVVFVPTESMMSLVVDMLAKFEKHIVALRCGWLEELAERTAARYEPFVCEQHPKSEQFASLLNAEDEYYAAEACVQILEPQEQLTYLSQQRKKLHDLFVDQLRHSGEHALADALAPALGAEWLAIESARCKFVTFGMQIVEQAIEMQRAYNAAQDEDDEARVRRMSMDIRQILREERKNLGPYVPDPVA